MNRTYGQVRELLVTGFGVPADQVREDRTFHDLELDSLALEELRTMTEERFDVDLQDAGLGLGDTVATLTAAVEAAGHDTAGAR